MLKESSIIRLSKKILKRYEHNFKNGVIFLYNVKTEEIWAGNDSSNDVIQFINGKRCLKEIYLKVQPLFPGYEYAEIKESFDSLINELLNKNFLEIAGNTND